MTKFYSPSTGGFYDVDVHGKENIPGDVFQLTDDEWLALLREQETGKEIVPGVHGGPIARDPDPAPGLLFARDQALRASDWLVARHRDEVEIFNGTTLTPAQYSELQHWRQALRNLAADPNFPRIELPAPPAFLTKGLT